MSERSTNLPADAGTAARFSWLSALAIVCIVAGVFFRIYRLDGQVFWHDEVWTAYHVTGHSPWRIGESLTRVGGTGGPEALQSVQHFDSNSSMSRTLRQIAVTDSQHPPLFYLTSYAWTRWFGDSVASFRAPAAVFGILAIGAFYWLALRLFDSHLAALIGAALFAIAPYHIVYSQEAREYSLWTLMTLLSSVALLAALRQPESKKRWTVYGVSLAVGLYAFALTLTVIAVHAVVVAFEVWRPAQKEDVTAGRRARIRGFLGAAAAACVAFGPWLVDIALHRGRAQAMTEWMTHDVGLAALVRGWADHFGVLLVDLPGILALDVASTTAACLIIALSVIVVTTDRRATSAAQRAMMLGLFLIPFVSLALPDVCFGGKRSLIARYLVPMYIGGGLLVTAMLARTLVPASTRSGGTRMVASLLFVALAAGGILTAWQRSQSPAWWNNIGSANVPVCINALASADRPLLLFDPAGVGTGTAVAISRYVPRGVRFRTLDELTLADRLPADADVFVLLPRPEYRSALVARGHVLTKVPGTSGALFRMTPAIVEDVVRSDPPRQLAPSLADQTR